MPNWCDNILEIHGSEAAIAAFKQAARCQPANKAGRPSQFSLQALYPTPMDLLETTSGFLGTGTPEQAALEAKQRANLEAYGFSNWYDWRIANWSTKWDVEVPEWSAEDPTYLRASFDSAWAPPEGAIRKIALDFPDLTFRLEYAEGGCDFSGVLCLKGDEELECWTGSFRERPEAFQWDEEEEDATA